MIIIIDEDNINLMKNRIQTFADHCKKSLEEGNGMGLSFEGFLQGCLESYFESEREVKEEGL